MTIDQFKGRCPDRAFFDFISQATEVWSNDACLGYAIDAARRVGLDRAQTAELVRAMRAAMDDYLTVDEAAEIYCKSKF